MEELDTELTEFVAAVEDALREDSFSDNADPEDTLPEDTGSEDSVGDFIPENVPIDSGSEADAENDQELSGEVTESEEAENDGDIHPMCQYCRCWDRFRRFHGRYCNNNRLCDHKRFVDVERQVKNLKLALVTSKLGGLPMALASGADAAGFDISAVMGSAVDTTKTQMFSVLGIVVPAIVAITAAVVGASSVLAGSVRSRVSCHKRQRCSICLCLF